MGIHITKTITCDACKKQIEETPFSSIISLHEYGLVFHPACFVKLTGAELLELQGVDETAIFAFDSKGEIDPTETVRVRKATTITEYGTARSTERAPEWTL